MTILTYHIVTLGCQMNKSDSERIRTVIEGMGYRWTDREEEASLLGVLACSVRQKSIDKVYSKIRKWNARKNHHNLITFISGCVLPADRKKFMGLFDILFSISELSALPDLISQYGVVTPIRPVFEDGHQGTLKPHRLTGINLIPARAAEIKPLLSRPDERIHQFWKVKPSYNSTFEAFIPIQNGCDKFCTYCAVPYTRGREISRPSGEILQEVRELVEKGYKSITLLGQNVNSYGLDKPGHEIGFAQLLRAIGESVKTAQSEFWLYFTSPHPCDMHDDVLNAVAEFPCLAKQIHLPLQSGDDKVLKKMNRSHSVEDYRKIVNKIRMVLPDATLFTDIIVGFTGETEEQFENTRKVMSEFRFNMAYIALYSPRPGAVSARWADDVPMATKKQRLHRLTEELVQHSFSYNLGCVGKKLKVLVTGADRKGGFLSGYTEGRITVRFASRDESLIGHFVSLHITSATSYSLEGEILTNPGV